MINNHTKKRLIENFFAKPKQYRAIATKYNKITKNFLCRIDGAVIDI